METNRAAPCFLLLTSVIVLASGFGLACSPQGLDCGNLTEEVLHSEHFDYHYCSGDRGVDSSLLVDLERHREVIGRALGLDESALPPHTTYLKDPRLGFRGHYSIGSGVVHVGEAMNEHDLVHAYALPAWGLAPSLLVEGLAAALACDQGEGATGDWRDFFDFDQLGPDASTGYDLSGRFVTFLILESGMAKFREFYEATIDDHSNNTFAGAFERTYGHDLDEAWDAALLQPEFCLPDWACSSPLARKGEPFVLSDVRPGSGLRTFESGATGVKATVTGAGFRPVRCDTPHVSGYVGGTLLVGGEMDLIEDHGQAPYVAWLELSPGRYAATHYTKAQSVGRTEVTFDVPLEPLTGMACSEAKTLTIDSQSTTYVSLDNSVASPDGEAAAVPRLIVESNGDARFQVHWSGTFPRLPLCPGCSDSGCVDGQGYTAEVSLQPTLALRVFPGNGFSTFRFLPLQ